MNPPKKTEDKSSTEDDDAEKPDVESVTSDAIPVATPIDTSSETDPINTMATTSVTVTDTGDAMSGKIDGAPTAPDGAPTAPDGAPTASDGAPTAPGASVSPSAPDTPKQ